MYFYFVFFSYSICHIIVTQWGGPGGIEVKSSGSYLSSVTLLIGSFDLQKPVPDNMTHDGILEGC